MGLKLTCGFLGLALVSQGFPCHVDADDWRNLNNAIAEIPSEGYCDQPYLVETPEGHWLCLMTTGSGREGSSGQHVVATRSFDQGRTWSGLVDIEPANGPEASWVVPFVASSGRIYAIYTYNFENRRTIKDYRGKPLQRVDTLGALMFKYSDNGGITWSNERYRIPMRNFEIDQQNVYDGAVQFFWSISKPIVVGTDVFMGMGKVGNFGRGFMHRSEGCVLKSPNLLSESDPSKIIWETLPEGNVGIQASEGAVADEHNLVSLSDGSLYAVFRTVAGFAGQSYSRDQGRTWKTGWSTYYPGGKRIKQPRALNKITRFKNGKYLLFFHNNGTTNYTGVVRGSRNPTWLAGGIERDGYIHWTQPEVFLYDEEYHNGISYPDWLEADGRYFISETQKTTARIHEVPSDFLEQLWNQFERKEVTREGLAFERAGSDAIQGLTHPIPEFGPIWNGASAALEFAIETGPLHKDQILLSTRVSATPPPAHGAVRHKGQGIEVSLLKDGQIQVLLDDLSSLVVHRSGNQVIQPHTKHHIVINIDGESKVLSLVVDGDLLDGGDSPFGYTRFSPFFSTINGTAEAQISDEFQGTASLFRIYKRYLTTTESIGNYRAVRGRIQTSP